MLTGQMRGATNQDGAGEIAALLRQAGTTIQQALDCAPRLPLRHPGGGFAPPPGKGRGDSCSTVPRPRGGFWEAFPGVFPLGVPTARGRSPSFLMLTAAL